MWVERKENVLGVNNNDILATSTNRKLLRRKELKLTDKWPNMHLTDRQPGSVYRMRE